MTKPHLIRFPSYAADSETLIQYQGELDLPFEICRSYLITGLSPNSRRGGHAHIKLRQVIVAASGSMTVSLESGGKSEDFFLDDPRAGLYVPAMYWRSIYNCSPGTILLAFVDAAFDEADYIRDYEEFLSSPR